MKGFRLLVILSLVLTLLGTPVIFGGTALAATSVNVTITGTPRILALTVSNTTWALGTVDESTTFWWTEDGLAPAEPFVDGDMPSTLTNTGTVASDIDIHDHNFTGGDGWVISTDVTPGEDEVSIRAGITGTANEAGMIQVITTDAELVDSLAASGTKEWCMSLETGTFNVTNTAEKTGIITLTISAAN